jgi:predicted dithiol-disulfide oxidoreductase (DUF899 family)
VTTASGKRSSDEFSRAVQSAPSKPLWTEHLTEAVVSLPKIVSYDEWVAARKELLVKEKEATKQRDRLNTERRELPMVEVKAYEFDGPDGKVSLLDLFEGRQQLIIYHFMFHPEWEDGCPSCTAGTDELSQGFLEHLHTRDTSYAMVSRAPLAKLERWKIKKGWDIPWYSAGESDFNYDFGVTIDASRGFDEFNFRSLDEYAAMGHESMKTADQPYDMPGRTCFLNVEGRVFRTYSQYARGLESTGGSYYFLDLTALGRQEDWEEPKGRSDSARGNTPDFTS